MSTSQRMNLATANLALPHTAMAQGPGLDERISDLVRLSTEANSALMRGDAGRYFELTPACRRLPADVALRRRPEPGWRVYAGTDRRDREVLPRRYVRDGVASRPTFRPKWWSWRSSNGQTLRSAVCGLRTGRSASPWCTAGKGRTGTWCIGMPIRLPMVSHWNRRPHSLLANRRSPNRTRKADRREASCYKTWR